MSTEPKPAHPPTEQEDGTNHVAEVSADVVALQQQVEDIKAGVEGAVAATSLDEKVEALRAAIAHVGEQVAAWRGWQPSSTAETFAQLQEQVEDVQAEWQTLTTGLQAQRERLETLLQSFPSAVEVSAVRALAMRVTHLEELVDQLLGEQRDASARRSSRTQLYVSITALVVTVALWGIFIVTNALKG
jgi:predicted nuclease with TOPRIM domain